MDLVSVGIDVRYVGVQLQVDVTLVVPLRLVNGDRRFRQLPLGELLDEDPVIQCLPSSVRTVTDASGSASRIVSAADAPAMPSPMITCDVLMYGRYEIRLNVDCYLRIVCDSALKTPIVGDLKAL